VIFVNVAYFLLGRSGEVFQKCLWMSGVVFTDQICTCTEVTCNVFLSSCLYLRWNADFSMTLIIIIILQGSTCLLCFCAAYFAEASGTTFVCSVVLWLNGSWSPQRAAGESRGTVCMCNALPCLPMSITSTVGHEYCTSLTFFLQEIWQTGGVQLRVQLLNVIFNRFPLNTWKVYTYGTVKSQSLFIQCLPLEVVLSTQTMFYMFSPPTHQLACRVYVLCVCEKMKWYNIVVVVVVKCWVFVLEYRK